MGKKMKSSSNKENCSQQILDEIISLDFSSDSDIIESSPLNENRCNFPIKAKWKLKRSSGAESSNISGRKLKNKSSDNALSLSLRKSFNLADGVVFDEVNNFQTPSSCKISKESNFAVQKFISTLKHTPEGPYLSKSKLRNIEEWLNRNSVETVRTPPFANLSVTPVNSFKKRILNQKKNFRERQEESSIDSEVEGVLKAVYGDNWKQKNVHRPAKTEPKKKPKKIFSPASLKKKESSENFRSVRRNILSGKKLNLFTNSYEEINFDDSVVSGVQMINLDSSNISNEQIDLDILKKCKVSRERKNEANSSSLESLFFFPAKKKEARIMPLNKAKNSRERSRTCSDNKAGPDVILKTPKKTFLASLSVSTPTSRCHPEAQYYKVNFKSKKEELVKKLYKLYNREVFDEKLAEDMNFSWNVKLRGTAGYCYNKRVTKSSGEIIRSSRIEFSSKIVDRADRLRDTMIHELCHAASWVIDGILDGHGRVWNKWASKAMERFPELPAIKKCHNYDIFSKYVYRCTGCGYSIKRHSKSINTDKKRCGHCYGTLELLINKKKRGIGEVPAFDTTKTLPTPNKFALFVKENYHTVKSTKTCAKHSEIMKTLAQQYALYKSGSKAIKKSEDGKLEILT